MIAWTTPTFPILIKGIETSNEYDIYITISQGLREVTLQPSTVVQTSEGVQVEVTLTQAQSGVFKPGREALVQANIVDSSGYRAASNLVPVLVELNLIEEVLQNA